MTYNIYFDVASVILLATLIAFIKFRNGFKTSGTSIYNALVIITLVTTLSEFLNVYAMENISLDHLPDVYFTNIIYQFSVNALSVINFCYCLFIVKKDQIRFSEKIIIFAIPIIEFIALVTTPFTGFIFSFEKGYIEYGIGYYAIILFAGLALLVFEIILLSRHKQEINSYQKAGVIIAITSFVGVVIIEALFPTLLIGNFIFAVADMSYYILLERPEDYMYLNTYSFNRKAFEYKIQLEKRMNRNNTICAFTFRNADYIRQCYGHAISEQMVLKAIKYMQKTFGNGVFYYLGSFTFAFIFPDDEVKRDRLCLKIESIFERPIDINGRFENVTPLIVYTDTDRLSDETEEVMLVIKEALEFVVADYDAQTVTEIPAEIIEKAKRERVVVDCINNAIRNKTFDVFYQPIFNIETKSFKSAEALIRLNDPKLGFISPEEFIPLAEQRGLIGDISDIVFRKVCNFIKENDFEKLGISYIEVNLSMAQCSSDKLGPHLYAIMKECNINPKYINLELTETAASENGRVLKKTMSFLNNKGVTFSLDDYGSGRSNANYLIEFPVNLVKIDKTIVWSAAKNKQAEAILQYMIDNIKAINKSVLIEGIETEDMLKMVKKMGAEYIQGYYYSKPISENDYLNFMNSNGTL